MTKRFTKELEAILDTAYSEHVADTKQKVTRLVDRYAKYVIGKEPSPKEAAIDEGDFNRAAASILAIKHREREKLRSEQKKRAGL